MSKIDEQKLETKHYSADDISSLLPKDIVKELDRFVIGQNTAKKAVAVALRNRYRRMKVGEPMRSEITPKNILMIGSTGVGKTEIARRLAKLAKAPFIKVEATKFTEVGYVGRDVESIIRDLTENAINDHKTRAKTAVFDKAKESAITRIIDSIAGTQGDQSVRDRYYQKIVNNELDNKEIDIAISDTHAARNSNFEIPGMPGATMGVLKIGDLLGKSFGEEKTKNKRLLLKDALEILIAEESEKMIDQDKIIVEALESVKNDGIVFIDEIDKITSRSNSNSGNGQVSREGVQRDLLPLIEGTSVSTKYGSIVTDHILFIASGAFHLSKPSDLLPELQGRLPTRVQLESLEHADLVRILKEPESSLIKQYTSLISTEGISLNFTDDAIDAIAAYAVQCNEKIEDIGARRLHTVLEKLLEDISYDPFAISNKEITIDRSFADNKLASLVQDKDLSKFIL